jgi:hypothetical protein
VNPLLLEIVTVVVIAGIAFGVAFIITRLVMG